MTTRPWWPLLLFLLVTASVLVWGLARGDYQRSRLGDREGDVTRCRALLEWVDAPSCSQYLDDAGGFTMPNGRACRW